MAQGALPQLKAVVVAEISESTLGLSSWFFFFFFSVLAHCQHPPPPQKKNDVDDYIVSCQSVSYLLKSEIKNEILSFVHMLE